MKKRVLSVDDSSTIRQIVKNCLEKENYDVFEAEDGLDALKKLEGVEGFDLLVVDVNMPNMDGISLVKELRKNPNYNTTPILMLTTESDTEQKLKGAQSGATGWIVKPFNPPEFVKIVKRMAG